MRYRFQHGEQVYEIVIERQGEGLRANVDGKQFDLEVLDEQPGVLSLRVEGRPVNLYWAVDGGQKWVSLDGCTYRLDRPAPSARRASQETGGGESVRAPMPAQVRAVQVSEGEAVEKGQTILLLEAMKMEIRVKAPTAGMVTRLMVQGGQTVEKDQVLAQIRSLTPGPSPLRGEG